VTKLPLTLACGPYDRTRALADGRIDVQGVELRYVCLEPEEIFFRMLRFGEFDASEMSLSTYLLTHQENGPFVAIPVFPSRAFRHSGIYVSHASGLAGQPPEQLRGATVGVAEYQLTANVWIRGILADQYGIPVSSVRYRTGGLNAPGRREKILLRLPPELDLAPIADAHSLSDLLAKGELDAIYSPRAPDGFADGHADRLFTDSRAEEQRYFEATGIFPIMHVIVIHRRVYDRNPWVAQELVKAFERAKTVAYQELQRTVALSLSLPWVREEYETTIEHMGADYWSYGLAANRHGLETFGRYAEEQYLLEKRPTPDELFAPESVDQVII
jgi:4,5-dihydroxyphthalate decarboxylase